MTHQEACAKSLNLHESDPDHCVLCCVEARRELEARILVYERVFRRLQLLLERFGSVTNARWDQHVRYMFGDEVAEEIIRAVMKA